MNFKEAKAIKNTLEGISTANSNELNNFLKPYKSDSGLIPNEIRESKMFKELKQKYDLSFRKLQDFNRYYIKTFKREISEERKLKYKNSTRRV